MAYKFPERRKQPEKPLAEWRRVAIKPLSGKKADILLALANVSRAENDRLPLYELLGAMIEKEWQAAKGRGLVNEAMVKGEAAALEPIYVRAEEVA